MIKYKIQQNSNIKGVCITLGIINKHIILLLWSHNILWIIIDKLCLFSIFRNCNERY